MKPSWGLKCVSYHRGEGLNAMLKVLTTIAETNPRGDVGDVFWKIDSNAHLSITVSS